MVSSFLSAAFLAVVLNVSAAQSRVTKRDCTFSVAAAQGDTCASIASEWGITEAQFISYNPSVGDDCSGLVIGNEYCVEMDYGQTTTTTTSTTSKTTSSTATTTTPAEPSPTQDGITPDCTSYYKVVTGDTCGKIVSKFGTFTLDDFYKWNPALGTDCSQLLAGYYVCVGVPGTPTTPITTTTATTTPTGPSPTQTGLTSDCTNYYKAVSGDTCEKIVAKYGSFSVDDFISWNPAVGSDCSGLWAGYYVCVGVPGTPSTPTATSVTTTTTTTPSGPSPTQSGLNSQCTNFYKVVSGDSCEKIVNNYGTFTLDDFYSWNPAVGKDCSALWVGYYVCVGVPGTPTAKPTTTTTTAPSGPSPTQTGIISTCNKYYQVQSGDYCQKIVDQYSNSFTLDQFYTWNPAVGSDCSNLWVGYYVCVGVSSQRRIRGVEALN